MISMKYIPRNEANTVTPSSLCVQKLPFLWFCPHLCKQRAFFYLEVSETQSAGGKRLVCDSLCLVHDSSRTFLYGVIICHMYKLSTRWIFSETRSHVLSFICLCVLSVLRLNLYLIGVKKNQSLLIVHFKDQQHLNTIHNVQTFSSLY